MGFVAYSEDDGVQASVPENVEIRNTWREDDDRAPMQDDIALALQALEDDHPDCDVIILYGSTLFSDDYAREIALSHPTVDAVITGGSSPASELLEIDGRRRVLSFGNNMRSCGAYTSGCVDHLRLAFDNKGEVNNYTHSMIGLGEDYKADEVVWPALTVAYDDAYEALGTVVGYTHIDIDGDSGTIDAANPGNGCLGFRYKNGRCDRGGCRRADCPAGKVRGVWSVVVLGVVVW